MTLVRFPVRVYYEDTDAGGIVYHSQYLNFAERARTEMVRTLGIAQNDLLDGGKGFAFAVRSLEIDYLKPARLDDLLVVETEVAALGGASVDFRQVIRLDAGPDLDPDLGPDVGIVLARLAVRVAFIRMDGRPARIPAQLRASLRDLISERL